MRETGLAIQRLMHLMASIMMERNSSSRPRLIVQRMGERRRTTYLKGPPFINEEGLVLVDRRSNGERRKSRNGSEICALLRNRNP